MTLTVKHVPANGQQIPNLQLLVSMAKQRGANRAQMAAAMATMIQESTAINMKGGDRDSAGLYQQRPSMGWGSYAQVTTPSYAINKFLTPFLNYCRQGMGLFEASDKVQGSAFPAAPRQWYDESWANVTQLVSGKDFIDATSLGGGTAGSSTTRVQPYEFSRGNAGQRETSWDCIGRLAEEVAWDRFMRAGALWFVSEAYLKSQPPRFAFTVGARGVTAINFDADSRRNAAEATVTALAKRWSVLPGDVVTVSDEGPGDGLWLVSDTHRTLWDDTTEITLKRPVAPKLEPANTTTTTTVAGVPGVGGATNATAPKLAQDFYAACKAISDKGLPYVYGGGHGACGVVSGGGYDCSGSVCAALAAVKLGYRLGGPCDVSGTMASNWGQPGPGKYFTMWASAEHVWIQFKGFPNWRFDTSPHGDGANGPRLRKSSRSTATFTPKHWPNL
jgi:hypothetical protein